MTLPLLLTANDLRQLLHPYLIRPSSWRVICVSVAPQWGHGTASGGNSQLIMWLADLRFRSFAVAATISGLLRLPFAWRCLSFRRRNDDEIGEIPRKWRLLPAVRGPAVARHVHLVSQGLRVASIGLTPVPGHHDGHLSGSRFQRVEPTHGAAAHDDFERFFLRCRGTAGRGTRLCGHVRPWYRHNATNSLIRFRDAQAGDGVRVLDALLFLFEAGRP